MIKGNRFESKGEVREPLTRSSLVVLTLISLGFGLAIIVRAFVGGA
jgi:hypothetical protein